MTILLRLFNFILHYLQEQPTKKRQSALPMNTDDKLISSVFASAVKLSLSEQKKKGSSHNKTNKKAAAKKQSVAAEATSHGATASHDSSTEDGSPSGGWVTVAGSHQKKSTGTPSPGMPPDQKKDALTDNAFFLPRRLEKHLHKNKPSTTAIKPLSLLHEMQQGAPSKMSKSYRKNQRRSLNRAKKRQEQENAAPLQEKVLILLPDIPASDENTKSLPEDVTEAVTAASSVDTQEMVERPIEAPRVCQLLSLPYDVITNGVLSYLRPEDMAMLGSCSKQAKELCQEGYLWQSLFKQKFPTSELTPMAMKEWRLAYQLTLTKIVDRLRCYVTQNTFFEDVLGVGVAFTVNPKTKMVDYIDVSQDLVSQTAFSNNSNALTDAFGNTYNLFLPLYFSEEYFQRALPQIRKTILKLARTSSGKKVQCFEPNMVLDFFPKIVTTFVVLLCDQGIAACQKSYKGLVRIHRLFLALANEYPEIQREALRRLRFFASDEKYRTKEACRNLGAIPPLLMIVDEAQCGWPQLCWPYLTETFDRCVLWVCKKHPQMEKTHNTLGQVESEQEAESRVELTLKASQVTLRLVMFHAYYLRALCLGTTQERANRYDRFFGQPEPDETDKPEEPASAEKVAIKSPPSVTNSNFTIRFAHFRQQVNFIMTVQSWQKFFRFLGLKCPPTKADMARRLRGHVLNSRRKRYHQAGMDFSKIQASGTSKILAKGQEYSASSDLRRVVFQDDWSYHGGSVKFLDATCLLYSGKRRLHLVDFCHKRVENGAVAHSGDVMRNGGGSHTIHLDLQALPSNVTSCVFVLSAYAGATMADIVSPSISFTDAESGSELCKYDLDAQDKVSYLTSVIMCRLYRVDNLGTWHVQAIGDAAKGSADNYGPIYQAVEKLL